MHLEYGATPVGDIGRFSQYFLSNVLTCRIPRPVCTVLVDSEHTPLRHSRWLPMGLVLLALIALQGIGVPDARGRRSECRDESGFSIAPNHPDALARPTHTPLLGAVPAAGEIVPIPLDQGFAKRDATQCQVPLMRPHGAAHGRAPPMAG
jgi:hypothetical protein